MSVIPVPPFKIGDAVRPTKALLARYPAWADVHDRECSVATIEPSFARVDGVEVFTTWTIMIAYANELSGITHNAVRWLVGPADVA